MPWIVACVIGLSWDDLLARRCVVAGNAALPSPESKCERTLRAAQTALGFSVKNLPQDAEKYEAKTLLFPLLEEVADDFYALAGGSCQIAFQIRAGVRRRGEV